TEGAVGLVEPGAALERRRITRRADGIRADAGAADPPSPASGRRGGLLRRDRRAERPDTEQRECEAPRSRHGGACYHGAVNDYIGAGPYLPSTLNARMALPAMNPIEP